jgi:hypothetical protein
MDRATKSAGPARAAESPRASSLRETRAMLERLRDLHGDSDHHDDMRRAGDGRPDKDAAFEEMLTIT